MVYLHNSSVHTKSYNLVIGQRKISGAAGSVPKTRRVLAGVQKWSTPEGVVTAKRRRFYASRSRGAGLLLT